MGSSKSLKRHMGFAGRDSRSLVCYRNIVVRDRFPWRSISNRPNLVFGSSFSNLGKLQGIIFRVHTRSWRIWLFRPSRMDLAPARLLDDDRDWHCVWHFLLTLSSESKIAVAGNTALSRPFLGNHNSAPAGMRTTKTQAARNRQSSNFGF
jgi:hypothetical protein